MKILITGTTGFFGQEIVKQFNSDIVYCLNRHQGDFQNDLAKSTPSFNQTFDLVIHNAGLAHFVPKNENNNSLFFDVNVEGTKNLLKGLENAGIPKKFIFISSVSVYGLTIGKNINENYSLSANDPYGLSKIKAEEIIGEWCKKNNVLLTILRLPLLVGKNPPGNLGSMIKGIQKGYYFNIDGGKAKKSMVLTEDVAHFIPVIANYGGVFNLTDGYHPSFFEISSAISKKNVLNIPLFLAKFFAFFGNLIGDKAPINSRKLKKIVNDLTFDDTEARKYGWNPKLVLNYLESNEI